MSFISIMSLNFIYNKYTYKLEKAMAPHSSTLAWRISWTEEPGRLQSMGSLRVWYDWATSLSLFTFIHWRRKWQPTPVFLPGESQGRRSLVGCRLWGRTESDTTDVTYQHTYKFTYTYINYIYGFYKCYLIEYYLTTSLWRWYYYYNHFTDKGSDA